MVVHTLRTKLNMSKRKEIGAKNMADLKTGLFPYLTYLNRFRKSHQYDSNKADNISFELAGLPQATGTECSVKSLKIP